MNSDNYGVHMHRAHAAFMATQRANTFHDQQLDPLRAAVAAFLHSYASADVSSDFFACYIRDLAGHIQDTEQPADKEAGDGS